MRASLNFTLPEESAAFDAAIKAMSDAKSHRNCQVSSQQNLTDAEREAIRMSIAACEVEQELNLACDGRQSFAGMWSDRAGALRNLLERTK